MLHKATETSSVSPDCALELWVTIRPFPRMRRLAFSRIAFNESNYEALKP
jgi:hypothetical protein